MTNDLENIRDGYNWLLKHIGAADWGRRKLQIEQHLQNVNQIHSAPIGSKEFESLSVVEDRIGWYIYLGESYFNDRASYEPIQGARVIPIFLQFGKYREMLGKIAGIEEKLSEMCNGENAPDPILFEILTALLYARNGWSEVGFIPERRKQQTPDIRVRNGGVEWNIECKRLIGCSDYSTRERKKWLKMWQPLARFAFSKSFSLAFEITFHVELENLPDDFVIGELAGKLPLAVPPCTIIEDQQWTVKVRSVDMERIQGHLSKFFVKNPSNQLQELILGRRLMDRGGTYAFSGTSGTLGVGTGTNRYIDWIDFAVGAIWNCDAPASIDKKARYLKSHLEAALSQLPPSVPSVVHIGLETLDGWSLERERFKKICDNFNQVQNSGKMLHLIYCHLFQAYAPPEEDWIFDETVYRFENGSFNGPYPLAETGMIAGDGLMKTGTHWGTQTHIL